MSERTHAGRVAAITGGCGGIGRAVALALAARGAHVALLDRDPAVESIGAELGLDDPAESGHRADVTDLGDMERAMRAVVDRHGRVDILVNSAGVVVRRGGAKIRAAEMSAEEWRQGIEINLTGVFNSIRAALPHMVEHGWGRIVTLSSQGGRTGGQFSSVDYGAAKAGVIGLSRTLAAEVGRSGVTVNCVAPGRVATAMTANPLEAGQNQAWVDSLPVPRMASAEEVAAAVAFLSSEDAGYITGATLDINGGGFMA